MKIKFNAITFLLIISFVLSSILPVFGAESATFSVVSCTPQNKIADVSPVDCKMLISFSEDINFSTVNSNSVEVSGNILGGFALVDSKTLCVYFSKSNMISGSKYTVSLKNTIKSKNNASLVPYQTEFTLASEAPKYYQLTNGEFDDKNDKFSYFDGAQMKTLALTEVDGKSVMRVKPEWSNGVIAQNVLCEGGVEYTAKAIVKTEQDEKVQLQCCYVTEDNTVDPYHYGPSITVKADTWTTIEATFLIPENVSGKVDIRIAFAKQFVNAYVDFFQFYESGNDMYEPKTTGSAARGITIVDNEKNCVNMLSSMGIFPNSVVGSSVVNRIDLAKIILNIIGLKNVPLADEQKFLDCSGEAQNVADSISDLGIMIGDGNGNFEPTKPATLDAALKVMLSVMGWKQEAENNGGFPAGYLNIAGKLGILDSVSGSFGDALDYDMLAKIIDNAMDAEVLSVIKISSEDEITAKKDGKKFSDVYLGVVNSTGIIDGTPRTYLSSSKKPNERYVTIDGKSFICYADVNEYLGYRVRYYYVYNRETEENEIRYICGLNSLNEVYEFSTEEYEFEYSDGKYSFYNDDNNKKRIFKLSDTKNVIYNGKYLGSYTENESTFVPVDGKVKLISNGNEISTVVITNIRTILVAGIDNINSKIYDSKINNPVDLYDKDEVNIRDKTGRKYTLKNIKVNNVLTVIESMDKQYIDIIVSTETISGIVSGINKNNDKNYITIGDSKYGSVVSMTFECVPGYFDISDVITGLEAVFFLNADGKICGFDVINMSESVGYLIDAKTEGIDDVLNIKIFDKSNQMKRFSCAGRIIIDNVTYKDMTLAVNALKKGTNEVVAQLVLYKSDANGNIASIDTAYNKEPNTLNYKTVSPSNGESADGFRITYSSVMQPDGTVQNPANAVFNTNSLNFNYKVQLSTNPTIFVVPIDAKDDEVKYQVTNNYWILGNMYSSYIESYMVTSQSFVTDYLVIFLNEEQYLTNMMNGEKKSIIRTINKSLDDGGNVRYEIKLLSGETFYADESYDLSYLEPGDYISYRTDRKSYIWTDIKLLFDASENTLSGVSNDGFTDGDISFNYVKVYEKRGSVIKTVPYNADGFSEIQEGSGGSIIDISKASIFIYDKKSKNKVRTAQQSNILDYVNSGDDYSSLLLLGANSVIKTILIISK